MAGAPTVASHCVVKKPECVRASTANTEILDMTEDGWSDLANTLPDGSSYEPGAECLCSNKCDALNLGLEQLLFRAATYGGLSDEEICRTLWRWMKLIREGSFQFGEEGEPLPPATEDGRAFADKMKALREACVRAGLTFECRQ
jgi:hypothetical protein